MKSSAVQALQKSHIESIAALLGKSSSQATKLLPHSHRLVLFMRCHREPHRRKTCICLLPLPFLGRISCSLSWS